MKKPILGLTPRHLWLYGRVQECVTALQRLEIEDDFEAYRKKAHKFAQELIYATTEWETYYRHAEENNE